jgi:hypothetical protein
MNHFELFRLDSLEEKVDSKLIQVKEKVKPLSEKVNEKINADALQKSTRLILDSFSSKEDTGLSNANVASALIESTSKDIYFYSGCKLIEYYKDEFHHLHVINKEIAMKSNEADKLIYPTYQFIMNQNQLINNFVNQMKILPDILNYMQTMQNDVNNLFGKLDELEVILSKETERINQIELQNWNEHQISQTKKYRESKLSVCIKFIFIFTSFF